MRSTSRVRIGVVGTSAHVANTHLTYLTGYRRAEVVAVCGRNPTRTADTARKFGVSQSFTNYEEMIEIGHLDALVIGAPDDLHYEMAMLALERGLHVLCEKPLAQNSSEALRMFRRAEEVGVKHMTNFCWRWLPAQRYARFLVEQGWLGETYDCTVVFRGGYGREATYAWRFDAGRGDGVLGDLGSHALDLARWYMGEIIQVSCSARSFVERGGTNSEKFSPANDSALLLLDFASGAHGSAMVSAVSHVGERNMEQQITIHGERGTIEVDYTGSVSEIRFAAAPNGAFERLTVPPTFAGPRPDDPFSVFEHLAVGDRLFVDSILDDCPVTPSFADGVAVQRVLDAAREAAGAGRWVNVATGAS